MLQKAEFHILLQVLELCAGYKCKGKVAPVFNWAPRHEDVLEEWRHSSTHSNLDTTWEWWASHPVHFTPWERNPDINREEGWVDPRAVKYKCISSCVQKENPCANGLQYKVVSLLITGKLFSLICLTYRPISPIKLHTWEWEHRLKYVLIFRFSYTDIISLSETLITKLMHMQQSSYRPVLPQNHRSLEK